MEPLVSIIIPVYNAQQTIERCLCSIRNQTFSNFEVLMVNDGSHDHSMRILEKFANLDPRFIFNLLMLMTGFRLMLLNP